MYQKSFNYLATLLLIATLTTPAIVSANLATDQAKNNQVASQVLAAFAGVPEITVTAINASKAGAPAPGTSVDVNGFVLQKEGALAAATAMKSGMAMGLKPNAKDEPGFHINATLEEHFSGRWGVLVGSMTEVIAGPADVAKAEQERKRTLDAALGVEPSVSEETGEQPTPSEPSKQMGTVGIPEMPTLPGTLNDALEAAGLPRTTTSVLPPLQMPTTDNLNDALGAAGLSPKSTERGGWSAQPGLAEARLAAAGYNPDGSLQRAVTIDYHKLLSVTAGKVSDYVENGTLESKIAMEQNLIGMALNSNIDQANLGQVNPNTIEAYGAINNRDTNGAFAKSLDNTIIPDLWKNSSTDQRAQLGISYLSNITGYTPNQSAGIIGNLRAESGLNHLEEAAGSERSSGLAQWNAASAAGERRQALEAYAGVKFSAQLQNGVHTSGPGAFSQLSFVSAEMEGRVPGYSDHQSEKVGSAFRANPNMTVADATKMFQNGFERPADRLHSLAYRQKSASEALTAYYEINPAQNNYATTNNGAPSQPQPPPGNENVSGNVTSPRVDVNVPNRIDFNLGQVKVSIEPLKVLDVIPNLLNALSGLFENNTSNNSNYMSLPANNETGKRVSILEEITVLPGRPTVCPAGSIDEGFTFAVKLSHESQSDHAYSCEGQTVGDYFIVVLAYLSELGINNVEEVEMLQKMRIIIQ